MANDWIWLKSYPPGVPAEIDPADYASLTQWMAQSFQLHAERKAYTCMGHSMRYGELDLSSRALAA